KIASVGLPLNCEVADVVRNGVWCWPPELSNCFDALVAVTLPSVDDGMNERVLWRTNKGRLVDFSVSYVADNCWFQEEEEERRQPEKTEERRQAERGTRGV
ncbi:hypothetical protein Tco_0162219, partial [Tanacetum coccineum]